MVISIGCAMVLLLNMRKYCLLYLLKEVTDQHKRHFYLIKSNARHYVSTQASKTYKHRNPHSPRLLNRYELLNIDPEFTTTDKVFPPSKTERH